MDIDDKYHIVKNQKPETKQEEIQYRIEELVKLRDKLTVRVEKEKIQSEIMRLFAQFERLKL